VQLRRLLGRHDAPAHRRERELVRREQLNGRKAAGDDRHRDAVHVGREQRDDEHDVDEAE